MEAALEVHELAGDPRSEGTRIFSVKHVVVCRVSIMSSNAGCSEIIQNYPDDLVHDAEVLPGISLQASGPVHVDLQLASEKFHSYGHICLLSQRTSLARQQDFRDCQL